MWELSSRTGREGQRNWRKEAEVARGWLCEGGLCGQESRCGRKVLEGEHSCLPGSGNPLCRLAADGTWASWAPEASQCRKEEAVGSPTGLKHSLTHSFIQHLFIVIDHMRGTGVERNE